MRQICLDPSHESLFKQHLETGVHQAAEILDQLFPVQSWATFIDVDRLDMASHTECILGQLFGTYLTGIAAILQLGQQKVLTGHYVFASNLAVPYWKKEAEARTSPYIGVETEPEPVRELAFAT